MKKLLLILTITAASSLQGMARTSLGFGSDPRFDSAALHQLYTQSQGLPTAVRVKSLEELGQPTLFGRALEGLKNKWWGEEEEFFDIPAPEKKAKIKVAAEWLKTQLGRIPSPAEIDLFLKAHDEDIKAALLYTKLGLAYGKRGLGYGKRGFEAVQPYAKRGLIHGKRGFDAARQHLEHLRASKEA